MRWKHFTKNVVSKIQYKMSLVFDITKSIKIRDQIDEFLFIRFKYMEQ